jgi:hypothetical protein
VSSGGRTTKVSFGKSLPSAGSRAAWLPHRDSISPLFLPVEFSVLVEPPIDRARRGEGSTVFDWLVEVIERNSEYVSLVLKEAALDKPNDQRQASSVPQ